MNAAARHSVNLVRRMERLLFNEFKDIYGDRSASIRLTFGHFSGPVLED